MSSPFVAEIRMFANNFAPTGWAQCNGQLLPISQNTALFSLCGTFYGGDGRSTFALPNLQDSVPLHQGQGAGLSDYFLGQSSGSAAVTLITTEMPAHTHTPVAHAGVANSNDSSGNAVARPFGGGQLYTATSSPTAMDPNAISVAGSSLPHNNLMPYLVVNFCIALQGVFPSRS